MAEDLARTVHEALGRFYKTQTEAAPESPVGQFVRMMQRDIRPNRQFSQGIFDGTEPFYVNLFPATASETALMLRAWYNQKQDRIFIDYNDSQ